MKYSFICIRCRNQQPKEQTEELPTAKTSSATTSESIKPSKPDVVYANIEQNQEHPLYVNVPLYNDCKANDGILYSELQ